MKALVFVLLLFAAADAQTQCTTNDDLPRNDQTAWNWRNDFIALTRLGNHHMPSFGDGDSMTEPLWLTGGVPNHFGSDGFRETWYISRDSLSSTLPFYRLVWNDDHMDSHDQNEAYSLGYRYELTHGYAWTQQLAGMQPLTRYLKGSTFDHRTWLATETPPEYAYDLQWNSGSGAPRYGYQRFGNKLDYCSVLAMGYMEEINNTKFRVQFNKVWGNAIGRITWKPTNTQLVREQIGAMVQSTIFNSTDPNVEPCCSYNPTQSGGADNINFGNTRRWAGSPVLSSSVTNNGTVHTSEMKPLQ